MKKIWILFFFVLMGVSLAIFLIFYLRWGRTLVYHGAIENVSTGIGEVYLDYSAKYSLVDNVGNEILVDPENLNEQNKTDYALTFIPPQYALVYSVGYFIGWKDIEETSDKYLLTTDSSGGSYRHRVIFDKNRLALSKSWRETTLGVENVGFLNNKKYEISMYKGYLRDLEFAKLKGAIRKGDAILVFPMRIGIDWDTKDEFGSYLVGTLVLRRAFGINEFMNEIR